MVTVRQRNVMKKTRRKTMAAMSSVHRIWFVALASVLHALVRASSQTLAYVTETGRSFSEGPLIPAGVSARSCGWDNGLPTIDPDANPEPSCFLRAADQRSTANILLDERGPDAKDRRSMFHRLNKRILSVQRIRNRDVRAQQTVGNITDREVLMEFKKAIEDYLNNGPILNSWNPMKNPNICSGWVGVLCNDAQRLTVLNLSRQQGLLGPISPVLGNLSFMISLNLSGNMFAQNIPPSLGFCSNLVYLDLSHNNLVGHLPPELGALHKLRVLHLGYNFLEGKIPTTLDNCSNLVDLNLAGNLEEGVFFNGTIPPGIFGLKSLEKIDMSQNQLSGSIPWRELVNCTNLVYLDLYSNKLSGVLGHEIGRVTTLRYLYLHQNDLTGTIPGVLGNCTRLVDLDMSSNTFTGHLPPEFVSSKRLRKLHIEFGGTLTGNIPSALGNCTLLHEINLSNNFLDGTIPRALGNCSRLRKIHLHKNMLTGNIPSEFWGLHYLEKLDLGNNYLTGVLPDTWGNCTHLVGMRLNDNLLEGPLPSGLCKCGKLEDIFLQSNNLIGPLPPDIFRTVNLTNLNLASNAFNGSIPLDETIQCPKLRSLTLSQNQISGSIPKTLSNCTNLSFLYLNQNSLSGQIPSELGDIKGLTYVSFNYNHILGEIPRTLTNTSLIELTLSNNNLFGTIPGFIGYPDELNNIIEYDNPIQILDLSSNQLHGPLSTLANCTNLSRLKLNENSLSGQISLDFNQLSDLLSSLTLSQNEFSGHIPPSLENCSKLRFLDLSLNELGGPIPIFKGEFNYLQVLKLNANKLSGKLPSWIWVLPALRVLDLSNNALEQGLPNDMISKLNGMMAVDKTAPGIWDYGKNGILDEDLEAVINGRFVTFTYVLNTLVYFDLSNNLLTGSIPSNLGKLKGMMFLNLSANKFTGSLNESLGLMGALEFLDVSRNKLHGNIPSTLVDLTFLQNIRLGSNNLSGPIPTRNQFATFDNSSYLPGNRGLCGSPLSRKCDNNSSLSNPKQHSEVKRLEHQWFYENFSIWAIEIGISLGFSSVGVILVLSKGIRLAFFGLVKLPSHQDCDRSYDRVYGLFREYDGTHHQLRTFD